MIGRDIVMVGQQAWDVNIGSNCRDIAIEFSKKNRVLFVNSPLDRITKIRYSKDPKIEKRINVIKGNESGLERVNEGLWVYYPDELLESVNWIRPHWLFRLLNRRNNFRFANSIQKAICELDFKDFILFNDNDMLRSFHLKELLKPLTSLYYSRDNMVATNYYRRHGRFLEPQIIRKNDLCVANSLYLQRYCENFNEHSYYVGQGCELELFQVPLYRSRPEVFMNIGRPIVGYVGALTAVRLDLDLIEFLSLNLPDFSFVFIGLEDKTFSKSRLHLLSNVYFLGPIPANDLARYIDAFDVCINPQKLNDLTRGNYPRKIDEYLAMGKPVVATKTDTMEAFAKFSYLASNKREFSDKIKEALLATTPKNLLERRAFAFSHSWGNSLNMIAQRITEVETLKMIERKRTHSQSSLQ